MKQSAGSASRLLGLAALAAAVAFGGYLVVRNRESTATHQPNPPSAAVAEVKPEPKPISPANEQASPVAANGEQASAAQASAAEASAAQAPAAVPMPSADSESDDSAPTNAKSGDSEGLITVLVKTVPPNARFFHKGKPVGRAPLTVELKPGERRFFEIGYPGYHARKVVVDGKQKEMTVAMRPQK